MNKETSNNQLIGLRIKEARKNAKLTQKDLATRLNLQSYQIIGQYESGIRRPKWERLKEIARILDVNPKYLAGESNRPKGSFCIKKKDGSKEYIDTSNFLNAIDKFSLKKEEQTVSDILMDQMKQEIYLRALQESMSYRETEILKIMKSLNNKGQDKAIEQVEMLTKIPEYRKEDTSHQISALNAAHERADIEVTEEMKKHDDDIMNDDSEWN